jgi:uncharacterized SAM-binding protein YcdF (DUF218 family)
MGLFLSKLLPLFIYPIGLSCILLTLAIVLILKRRSRRALIPISLVLIMMGVSSSGWFSTILVRSLEQQYLPQELEPAQAIVLLGGATGSQLAPRPWVDITDQGDRILHAAKLYRENKAPLIIPTGGRIAWRGPGDSEALDMSKLLQSMSVPESAIVLEPNALNTHENAVNVQAILNERKIENFLLVTSAAHMPRSMMIFRKLGLKPIAAPTDYTRTDLESKISSPQDFMLSLLPDAEFLNDTNRAIKEYIGIWVYRLKGWA